MFVVLQGKRDAGGADGWSGLQNDSSTWNPAPAPHGNWRSGPKREANASEHAISQPIKMGARRGPSGISPTGNFHGIATQSPPAATDRAVAPGKLHDGDSDAPPTHPYMSPSLKDSSVIANEVSEGLLASTPGSKDGVRLMMQMTASHIPNPPTNEDFATARPTVRFDNICPICFVPFISTVYQSTLFVNE